MGAVARLFVCAACVLLTFASSAFAQQRGSILGRVFDPDGLPLPGATITVTQAATGFTRTTKPCVTAPPASRQVASNRIVSCDMPAPEG